MTRLYETIIAATRRIIDWFGQGLEWFFYQHDAFQFKGIMTFALQLLAVLGVGISLQFLATPATVKVENKEPIGCFDMAIYEESYSFQNILFPQELRDSIRTVALHNWPKGNYIFSVGAVARGLPMIHPSDINHQILCWYVTPRSQERLEEVHRLEASLKESLDKVPSVSKISRIENARRIARAQDQLIDTSVQRELSAASFLKGLNDFSTPASPLDLAVLLKPYDSKSHYRDAAAWKEDIRITDINGDSDVLKAIEASHLKEEDISYALEQFGQIRFYLNWIEISTTSTHAVSAKVNVTIPRRGLSEKLGGTLPVIEEESYFRGSIEKLLPHERFWVLIKTNRPIREADISVVADPTPFFDPHRMWKIMPLLLFVVIAWTLGNMRPRLRH